MLWQPASTISSVAAVQIVESGLGIDGNLLCKCDAAGFVGAGGALVVGVGLGDGGLEGGEAALGLGQVELEGRDGPPAAQPPSGDRAGDAAQADGGPQALEDGQDGAHEALVVARCSRIRWHVSR